MAPALSFLWDHQVQSRPLLPGSALLEMAMAAGHMLATSIMQRDSETSTLLAECTIPASATLSDSPAAMQLQLVLGLREGSYTISSVHSRITHLAGGTRNCSHDHRSKTFASVVPANTETTVQLSAMLAAGPVREVRLASQLGCLSINPVVHTDGYCSHPAVVDGCLHLGASLAQSSEGDMSRITVPVVVRSYASTREFKPNADMNTYASCRLSQISLDGASVSSYSLKSAFAKTAVTEIADLEARPMRVMAATRKLPIFVRKESSAVVSNEHSGEVGAIAPRLLYHVLWEADSMTGQYNQEARQQQEHANAIALAVKVHINTLMQLVATPARSHSSSADAAMPTSQLLSLLQEVTGRGRRGTQIRVATTGAVRAGPSLMGPSAGHSSAAAWGMVRVAASEVSNARWALVDLDSQASISQTAAGEAVDVSGSLVRHGVTFQPVLLPLTSRQTATPTLETAQQTMMLITGGLGGAWHEFVIIMRLAELNLSLSINRTAGS